MNTYIDSTTSGTAWGSVTFTFRIYTFRIGPPRVPKLPPVCAHKLLGVACDAQREEVRQAYRRLAKIAHPDAGGDGQWMVLLNRLYELATP